MLDWDSEDNVLNLLVKYRQNTVLGSISKTAQGIIPLWTSGLSESSAVESQEEAEDDNSDQDDIWSLSNFTRDRSFVTNTEQICRSIFRNCRLGRGDGNCNQSIDLTAPSYSSPPTQLPSWNGILLL